MRNVLIQSINVSEKDVNPKAFQVTSSNYCLLRFYNVQNKLIDVSIERAVFICRVHAELIGEKKNVNCIG
jgi:hypothetical protein